MINIQWDYDERSAKPAGAIIRVDSQSIGLAIEAGAISDGRPLVPRGIAFYVWPWEHPEERLSGESVVHCFQREKRGMPKTDHRSR